ncbi:hypothetical protein KNO15_15725 [Leifsonia shinshuensis]|uniref:hypothetical protein n=1 Tax=Leifsonia shinshuensis TaxID=150026 RepID=UPI001F5128B5|nr:hypothetical protein [Leifsonia shinshuensis]MCI0158149.1 hypothetical protein [Leifsonia shinshuensis]
MDFPDNASVPTPLISRRTVARTAAWAAPAIVLSSASPAFAVSGVNAGTILLGAAEYDITYDKPMAVSGTLVPSPGSSVPDDLRLTAAVSSGFAIVSQPVVSGATFTMTVSGPKSETTGTLTVSSPNYPAYVQATASVIQLVPGAISKGYHVLPLANNWSDYVSEDDTRWFNTSLIELTAAKLGATKPLLDLRFDFAGKAQKDNFGNTPLVAPRYLGGRPAEGLGRLDVVTEARVVSLQTLSGGKAIDPSHGVGVNIGGFSRTGPGFVVSGDQGVPMWMPNVDQYQNKITLHNKVFAFAPTSLPKGSMGIVEVIHTIHNQNRQAKIGFAFQYIYR